MTPCPHCGAVRERVGRFIIESNPPAVLIDGSRVTLSPLRAAMLALLVQKGQATYEELDALCRPGNRSRSARVHMTAIRRVLPPGVAVVSLHGIGYQLSDRAPANPGTTQPQPA